MRDTRCLRLLNGTLHPFRSEISQRSFTLGGPRDHRRPGRAHALYRLVQRHGRDTLHAHVNRCVRSVNRYVRGVNRTVRGVNRTVRGVNRTVRGVNRTVRGVNRTVRGVNRNSRGGDSAFRLCRGAGREGTREPSCGRRSASIAPGGGATRVREWQRRRWRWRCERNATVIYAGRAVLFVPLLFAGGVPRLIINRYLRCSLKKHGRQWALGGLREHKGEARR